MNKIEQITTLISQLGDQGTTAFIWYLIADLLGNLISVGGWILFLCLLIRIIMRLFVQCNLLEELQKKTITTGYIEAVTVAIKWAEKDPDLTSKRQRGY